MKSIYFLLAFSLAGMLNVNAQFSSPGVLITDNQQHKQGKSFKGTALDTISCNADTLQYGRYKASTLQAINVSLGYALGQFYNAPGEVRISGFTFYGWVSQPVSDSVELICRVYEADSDSLPKGRLLQTERIKIDSTFGGGQLTTLEKHITFDSLVTTDKPYIIVIESYDTTRVALVANNWLNNDGRRENLASGTVGGTWYRSLNLNIGGNPLNCDLLFEPHVSFDLSANFTFKDCYNFRDSVLFRNTSSAWVFDPMYNRWAFSNNSRFSNLWNYGSGFGNFYAVDGATRYASAGNYDVRLIVQLLHFKSGTYCIDTIIHKIHFQPGSPSFSGINADSLCSGDSAIVFASSNGTVNWFRSLNADTTFQTGPAYYSKALFSNDTLYVQAVNEVCSTTRFTKVIKVNQKPQLLSIREDSVCLNSIANLSANADVGTINWYDSPGSSSPFYTGDVYSTGNLSNNVTYYVEANNNNCLSGSRLAVTAHVSSDFAPKDPVVVRDTIVCLLDGDVSINAQTTTGADIRWYNLPSGGTPFQINGSLNVGVSQLGRQTFYVDAFDGTCASSRIPVNVRTFSFPKDFTANGRISGCEGDSLRFSLNIENNGFALWYASRSDPNFLFSSNELYMPQIMPDTFWYQPTNGFCHDTAKYPVTVTVYRYGLLNTWDKSLEACSGKRLLLQATANIGEVVWYGDSSLSNELWRGSNWILPNVQNGASYWIAADEGGCRSKAETVQVGVKPSASAIFDFSIVAPGSYQFAARTLGQGFYRWDLGDGNTDNGARINYIYKQNGDFDVRLVVEPANRCNDTFYRTMSVSGLVSVYNSELNALRVYPNPFTEHISLEASIEQSIKGIEILNALGALVLKSDAHHQGKIDTRSLSSGMYVLIVELEEGKRLMYRLIKSETAH